MDILFIVKLLLLIIIVYAILKNIKTIIKVAIVLFAIVILIGIWGL